MAAVVRVKRRINEEPMNAFILNCKKRKVDENESSEVRENFLESKDEISTILKFAGTVKSQDENIGSQITKLTKDEAKQLVLKSRKPDIIEKSRKEMRQNLHDSRFKVVNCFRTIQENDENDETIPKEITVVDIEKQSETSTITTTTAAVDNLEINSESHQQQQNVASSSSSSSSQNINAQPQDLNNFYVYDLYLPEASNEHNMNVDYNDTTYLSIRPFDDLVYEDYCNDDNLSSNESDDSNAENYWTNDYPDEESIGDSDMQRRVYNEDDDDDYDHEISSDEDYYEGYIHSIECKDCDGECECNYRSYSSYKTRMIKNKNRKYSEDLDEFGDSEEEDD